MKKLVLSALFSFLALPAIAAPLDVVVTTTQLCDVTKQVTGDAAKVTCILRAGTDPHDYKLVRSDTAKFLAADVIIAHGLGLEGKMARALEQASKAKDGSNKLLYVADQFPQDQLIAATEEEGEHEHGGHDHDHEGAFDPHVWFDPGLWRDAAPIIADKLAAKDAVNAATYRANAAAWQKQVDDTFATLKSHIASVKPEARILVTSHDAFGYFGRAFGFEVWGVQGVSTENEAGLQHVNALVDGIVKRQVKAVFAESSTPDRSVKALIEGAKHAGWTVALGGKLYADTLGAQGSGAETYTGMLTQDVATIVGALK